MRTPPHTTDRKAHMIRIRNIPYGPFVIEDDGEEIARTYDPIEAQMILDRTLADHPDANRPPGGTGPDYLEA